MFLWVIISVGSFQSNFQFSLQAAVWQCDNVVRRHLFIIVLVHDNLRNSQPVTSEISKSALVCSILFFLLDAEIFSGLELKPLGHLKNLKAANEYFDAELSDEAEMFLQS